jgi:hypothetical protein
MRLTRIVSLIVVLMMVISFLLPAALAEGPTPQAVALQKIKPSLRPAALQGGTQELNVFVTAAKGTDVARYMVRSFTRPVVADEDQMTFGIIKASNLLKVASVKGVTSVQPIVLDLNGPRVPPGEDQRKPDLEAARARLEALRAREVPYAEAPEIKRRSDVTTAWHDVGPTHKSSAAWAKGYTGEGVLVAVADDGVDFPHPDLMDTWATVRDPNSPYYGWPMMFSPISMLLYVYDAVLGTNFLASNRITWYSDTSATPPVVASWEDYEKGRARLVYTPVGDPNPGIAHTYFVPLTSRSGVYHIGSFPDDNLAALYGEAVAVLVVDENRAGVYDTVYVDLDNDYDFTDEKPVTRESPACYRDMDGDGYIDISGGIVYFIADGENPIPVSAWLWSTDYAPIPANGSLVCFHGALDAGYTHGTQCASNVVGQGVVNAMAPVFADLPGDGTPQGVVVGAAPRAKMVGISNIYYNFDASKLDAYLFAVIGYDGRIGSGDEIQIVSNSYGSSDQDNDGWEYDGRYVSRVVRRYSPTTTFLFSTGNGAPGFGTTAPPSPNIGIAVGASTQFGSTGWDSILYTSQIVYNDVIPFSNRGPGANGSLGVDVVADGAYAAGAEGVNYSGFDSAYAWSTWGGTSRSAPVAMGNLALIYQAYKAKHGRWPTYDVARALLMSSATHLNYDVLTQGAGAVNAARGTDVAGGHYGFYAQPVSWIAGSYRGVEYPAFANLMLPGQTDVQRFTLTNDSNVNIQATLRDGWLRKIGSRSFTWTSADISEESVYNALVAPDYLIPIERDTIPQGTQLMVVRVNYPYGQMDLNGDYVLDNGWRLLVYNWTDINGNGRLWTDANGNGVVNHVNARTIKNIDGSRDLDWANSEIEQYEYVRFGYHRPGASTAQMWVHDPLGRMADGLFIGLQHQTRSAAQRTTTFDFQIDFYAYEDWSWLQTDRQTIHIPARSSVVFTATLTIPEGTPEGGYEGAILVEDPGTERPFVLRLPLIMNMGSVEATRWTPPQPVTPGVGGYPAHTTVIPVYVSVAKAWNATGSFILAGARANDPQALYNNGTVMGQYDWTWRAESGDWRFFFVDVNAEPAAGTKLIVRSVWDDVAPPTDLDTVILGPSLDRFTDPNDRYYDPVYYGPYTLDVVGKSPNTLMHDGVWRFSTASGGAEEWVTASLSEGLHELLVHNVLHSGAKFHVPFTLTVSTVSVNPSAVQINTNKNTGTIAITFKSGMPLNDLVAEAFGLSAPVVYAGQTVTQSPTQNPASHPLDETKGWKVFPFTLSHCSSVRITTGNATTNDIDLYVLYDANGDGVFSYPSEVVGSSGSPTSDEVVTLFLPPDGQYVAGVFGYDVTGGGTYDLTIAAAQGNDITVTGLPAGPVAPGVPVVLTLNYAKTMTPGTTYLGALMLGPSVAPGAIVVPIEITRR